MEPVDLLGERVEIADHLDRLDVWANERTPTPVGCFAVRVRSMGLSFRELEAVSDWLGVECCHRAVWYRKATLAGTRSDPPTAAPSRGAVDGKRIEVDGEKNWLYAAIDTGSTLLLEVDVYGRRGTGPAAFTRTPFSCSPSEIGDF